MVIELVRRRQAGAGELSDLLKDLEEALEALEVRIPITTPDFKDVGGEVRRVLRSARVLRQD